MSFTKATWQDLEDPRPFAAIRIRDTLIRVDAIDVVQPLGADRAKILLRSGEWVEVWASVDEVVEAMQRALTPGGYVRD